MRTLQWPRGPSIAVGHKSKAVKTVQKPMAEDRNVERQSRSPSPKRIRLDFSREELRELMREVAREVRAEQPPATAAGPGSSEAEEWGK